MHIRKVVRDNIEKKRNYIYEVCSSRIFDIISDEVEIITGRRFSDLYNIHAVKKYCDTTQCCIRVSFSDSGDVEIGISTCQMAMSAYHNKSNRFGEYFHIPKEEMNVDGVYILNNLERVTMSNGFIFREDGSAHLIAMKYLYDPNILAYHIKEEVL